MLVINNITVLNKLITQMPYLRLSDEKGHLPASLLPSLDMGSRVIRRQIACTAKTINSQRHIHGL